MIQIAKTTETETTPQPNKPTVEEKAAPPTPPVEQSIVKSTEPEVEVAVVQPEEVKTKDGDDQNGGDSTEASE